MMKTPFAFTVVFAIVLAACTPSPGGIPLSATINRDCGPADGPAFTVTIPVEGRGKIVTSIWQAPEIGGRRTFTLTNPTDATGSATLFIATDVFQPLSGTITFDGVQVDRPVNGSFRLIAATGESFEGSFAANWIEFPAYCG